MKNMLGGLLLAVVVGCGAPTPEDLGERQSYVVMLEPQADPQAIADQLGVTPSHSFSDIGMGFAAQLTTEQLARLTAMGTVRSVERDAEFRLPTVERAKQQPTTSWALQRIMQRTYDPNTLVAPPKDTGVGVPIYVIDTGVYAEHPDFLGNHVRRELNLVPEESPDDLNGHGTHVTGLICSKTYGVAKLAKVYVIKALNKNGAGPLSNIIKAIDYVVQKNAASRRGVKAIINMSLAGPPSTILDEAINRAADTGISIIAAAGNFRTDACQLSPAASKGMIGVGATDESDTKASFTNFGPCVNAFAPGVNVISTYISDAEHPGPAPSATLSGTAMGMALVTGVASLDQQGKKDDSPSALKLRLLQNATFGAIKGLGKGSSNNFLLYAGPVEPMKQ